MKTAYRHCKLVYVGCLVYWITACANKTATGVPRIEMRPSLTNLGELQPETDLVEKELLIKNGGTGALRLSGYRTSCGCTMINSKLSILGPDETQAIKIAIRPKKKSGFYSSTVTIFSDDLEKPEVSASFRWTEVSAISFIPNGLELGYLEINSVRAERLLASLNQGIDAKFVKLRSLNKGVRARLLEGPPQGSDLSTELPAGHTGVPILIEIDSGDEIGSHTAQIELEDESNGKSERLPIHWSTSSRWGLIPGALFKGNVTVNEDLSHFVIVKGVQPDGAERLVLKLDGRAKDFSVLSPKGGAFITVRFSLAAGNRSGVENHKAEFFLGSRAEQHLTLPITYMVRERL